MNQNLLAPNRKTAANDRPQASLLVIRHDACLNLGSLQIAAVQSAGQIRYWEAAAGEPFSTENLNDYSHVVVLGGSMSAYEEEQHPFLRHEFQIIEAAIDRGMPMLGICLGSQILARLLGAKVYRGQAGREAGWCEVEMTDDAVSDFLLREFPRKFQVFQFHQDTFDLPSGAVHLAHSKSYINQAFRYQQVWGLQFHLEFNEVLIRHCARLLEQDIQREGLAGVTVEKLIREAQLHDRKVMPIGEQFMNSFLSVPVQATAL